MSAANTAGERRASACDSSCPPRNRQANGQHSDAAKRCADGVNLCIAARGTDACGKWLAVRLDDGSVNATLFPEQSDAVRAVWPWERLHCFLRVPRQWVSLCEAESYLRFNRLRYDLDMNVMPDPRDVRRPGAVRDVIPRLVRGDQAAMMDALRLSRINRSR